MSQRHDVGARKEKARTQRRNARIDGEALALNLVRRGLAAPLILERYHKPSQTGTA
jgi:hypothetical protein